MKIARRGHLANFSLYVNLVKGTAEQDLATLFCVQDKVSKELIFENYTQAYLQLQFSGTNKASLLSVRITIRVVEKLIYSVSCGSGIGIAVFDQLPIYPFCLLKTKIFNELVRGGSLCLTFFTVFPKSGKT